MTQNIYMYAYVCTNRDTYTGLQSKAEFPKMCYPQLVPWGSNICCVGRKGGTEIHLGSVSINIFKQEFWL